MRDLKKICAYKSYILNNFLLFYYFFEIFFSIVKTYLRYSENQEFLESIL